MKSYQRMALILGAIVVCTGCLAVDGRAQAYGESVLHSFTNSGGDGAYSQAGLIMDSSENLYGTTSKGGASGVGTVFELVNSSGTYAERVLYSFVRGTGDGECPFAGVTMDSAGNLYGTTSQGGASGYGAVFEMVNSNGSYTENVLYSFTESGGDGANPYAGLTMDSAGNLYGTTHQGGASGNCVYGCGTVFELVNSSGTYTEKVLYSFTNASGGGPHANLVLDSSGNLYGTAEGGFNPGNGAVFELVNSNGSYTEKVLHNFTKNGGDGTSPHSGLIMDSSGNLYGTTEYGGASDDGTVFELVNSSGTYTEKVLYSFDGDGANPLAGLIMDASGNLYGTTGYGGASDDGTVFELDNSSGSYTERVLYRFQGPPGDGDRPFAGLIMDSSANLYGTTYLGGASGVGTVFKLIPVITLSPTSLAFGNQTVGTTSAAQNVTATNEGWITLTISSISVTGEFAQTNDCGSMLGAGASCTIMVTFVPTQAGTQSGVLTVTDSSAASPQTVSLTGVGTQPAVQLSPTSLSFPTEVVFTTSSPQSVTLTNTGKGTLSIANIAATGQFSQTNTCGSSVAPGGTCTITVKFAPKDKGPLAGKVSVTDNAPGSPQTVVLTGTGTYIQLSPTSINFGSQPVGTTSLPKQVAVTNKGDSAVSISNISIKGNDPGDFAQTNNCGSSLGSGLSCFIKLTFTPSAKGNRTASVSVSDNGGGSPQTLALSGTGT